MKKIQRQPGPSVSSPPAMTPTTEAMPLIAPHMPSARARWGPSGKTLVSRLSAAGAMNAEPRPWSPRATISITEPWASPATSEASAKITSPAWRMRRRPTVSASRPPSSRNPPSTVPYAVTTYWR